MVYANTYSKRALTVIGVGNMLVVIVIVVTPGMWQRSLFLKQRVQWSHISCFQVHRPDFQTGLIHAHKVDQTFFALCSSEIIWIVHQQ